MSGYPLLINLWDEPGANSKNRPEFFARATKRLLVRPGKVVHSNGWDARPGRLASHRVASPWIVGSNPEIKRRTARQQAVNRKAEGIEPRNA